MARTGPAIGRRVAPSRTSTANGGSRWSAARWRASDARKSRRSLLASPATTMPRTPIARARVSVSASTREPTTRIAPAEPDVEAAGAQLALGAAQLEAAPRRPAEGHDPADPAPGGPDRDRRPRPDLADDARERRLERVGHSPVATRQRPRQ